MKQYLVVKIAEGVNRITNLIALPGLYTLEAAQQFIKSAMDAEPDSRFLIQEVGIA